MGNRIKMSLIPDFAITSQRVMTQEGEREAAILICGEKILDVISISEIPSDYPVEDMANDVGHPCPYQ